MSRRIFAPILILILMWGVVSLSMGLVSPSKADAQKTDTFKNSLQVFIWSAIHRSFYLAGEDMVIFVKATSDCYLTLIDITPGRSGIVIFPADGQGNGLLSGGEVYRLPHADGPYQWKISGPAGRELIKAFATERPLPLSHHLFRGSELTSFLSDVHKLLSQGRLGNWAESDMWIEIREESGQ